jgi:hypothetical protein
MALAAQMMMLQGFQSQQDTLQAMVALNPSMNMSLDNPYMAGMYNNAGMFGFGGPNADMMQQYKLAM